MIAGVIYAEAAATAAGLAAGACLAAGDRAIVTVEPEHCCCVAEALAAGHPVDSSVESIAASGLGATRVGDIPFGVLRDRRARSLLVSEHDIVAARDQLWEQLRIAAEPAGATAYAAFQTGQLPGKNPAVIISGANTDWTAR